MIDASLSASRARCGGRKSERAQEQAELEGLAPQEAITGHTENRGSSCRAGLVAVYKIVSGSATMHDLYGPAGKSERYLSTALDNCKWGSAGKLIRDLHDDPEVFFRWKKSHVYSYAQLSSA